MAKLAIDLVVITPERKVLEETTDSVVIPAHDGELGILPRRAPLMCELGIGALRYQKAGRTERVMISGGFAQVHHNQVTVLTEQAVTASELTPEVLSGADREVTTARDAAGRARAERRARALRSLQSA